MSDENRFLHRPGAGVGPQQISIRISERAFLALYAVTAPGESIRATIERLILERGPRSMTKEETRKLRRALRMAERANEAIEQVEGETSEDDEQISNATDELAELVHLLGELADVHDAGTPPEVEAAIEVKRAHERLDALDRSFATLKQETDAEARRVREAFNTFASEGRAAISKVEATARAADLETHATRLRALGDTLREQIAQASKASAVGDLRGELAGLRSQVNDLANASTIHAEQLRTLKRRADEHDDDASSNRRPVEDGAHDPNL